MPLPVVEPRADIFFEYAYRDESGWLFSGGTLRDTLALAGSGKEILRRPTSCFGEDRWSPVPDRLIEMAHRANRHYAGTELEGASLEVLAGTLSW